jgi:gliding motility-associated-like protein
LTGKAPFTLKYRDNHWGENTLPISGNSIDIPSAVTGLFTFKLLELTDANGCKADTLDGVNNTLTADIYVRELPTVNMTDQTLCFGDSAKIVVTGTAPFDIKFSTTRNGTSTGEFNRHVELSEVNSNGEVFIGSADTGTYVFKLISIEDANCINTVLSASATVRVNSLPTVMVSGDNIVCEDQGIELTFSGKQPFILNYTVDGHAPDYYHLPTIFDMHSDEDDYNQSMLTEKTPGIYTANIKAGQAGIFEFELVLLKDANGCENDSAKTVIIQVLDKLPVEILETEVCANGSITVDWNDTVVIDYLHISFDRISGEGEQHMEAPIYHNIAGGNFVIPVDSLRVINASTDALYRYTINVVYTINDVTCGRDDITGEIKINPKPTVTMSDNVVCVGDGMNVRFTGKPPFILSYEVNGNNPASVGLPASPLTVSQQDTTIVAGSAGSFEFKFISLVDYNSCLDIVNYTVNVKVNDRPTVAVDLPQNNALCEGEGINLHFTGTAPYTLAYTVNGNDPGTFGLPSPIIFNDNAGSGDTTIIVGSAGVFDFEFTGLTDGNGCNGLTVPSFTLTVHELPGKPALTVNDVCYGETLTFTATSGYVWYEWIETTENDTVVNTDNTMEKTAAGSYTYKVRVQNTNGCWSEYSDEATGIVDTVPAKPVINPVTDICLGEVLTFETEAGYDSYYWVEVNTNTIIITAASKITEALTGTYTYKVRVQNSQGCWNEYSDAVSGEIYALPETPVINPVTDVCYGETLTFTATSGYTQYEWVEITGNDTVVNTNNTIVKTAAGSYTYKVRVQNTNGCWSNYSDVVSGEIYAVPETPVINPATDVCYGETLTFTATSGYAQYEWVETTGNDTVVNASNTAVKTAVGSYTYKVRVQNANGCWSDFSNEVSGEIYALPAKPVITPVSDICYGGTLTFIAPSGYVLYEWTETSSGSVITNGSATISQTNSGTYRYKVRVQNSKGCWSDYSDVVEGTVHPVLVIPVIEPSGTVSICEGSTLTLTATTGFANYTWYHNGTEIGNGAENTMLVNEAGKYTVKVTATYGCGSGTSEEITVEIIAYPAKPLITADGISDNYVWRRVGMNIVFEVSNKIDTLIYQWYHSGSIIAGGQGEALYLSSLRLMDAGAYTVTATTQNAGCSVESDNVNLEMRESVFVPRLVTPNNDNENDNLHITGLEIYPRNELIIINRWGNEVFRTTNYVNDTWQGDNLPDGVYFYKLRLIETNGYAEEKTGYFHLKR